MDAGDDISQLTYSSVCDYLRDVPASDLYLSVQCVLGDSFKKWKEESLIPQ